MQFNEEMLTAYLDDELSPDERALVEKTVAEQAEVAQLLEDLRAVRDAVQALPRLKPLQNPVLAVRERLVDAKSAEGETPQASPTSHVARSSQAVSTSVSESSSIANRFGYWATFGTAACLLLAIGGYVVFPDRFVASNVALETGVESRTDRSMEESEGSAMELSDQGAAPFAADEALLEALPSEAPPSQAITAPQATAVPDSAVPSPAAPEAMAVAPAPTDSSLADKSDNVAVQRSQPLNLRDAPQEKPSPNQLGGRSAVGLGNFGAQPPGTRNFFFSGPEGLGGLPSRGGLGVSKATRSSDASASQQANRSDAPGAPAPAPSGGGSGRGSLNKERKGKLPFQAVAGGMGGGGGGLRLAPVRVTLELLPEKRAQQAGELVALLTGEGLYDSSRRQKKSVAKSPTLTSQLSSGELPVILTVQTTAKTARRLMDGISKIGALKGDAGRSGGSPKGTEDDGRQVIQINIRLKVPE